MGERWFETRASGNDSLQGHDDGGLFGDEKRTRAKVPTSGEEWPRHFGNERERRQDSLNCFGSGVLEIVDRIEAVKSGQSTAPLKSQEERRRSIKYGEKGLQNEIGSADFTLANLCDKRGGQSAVWRMFYNYFGKVEDKEQALVALGFKKSRVVELVAKHGQDLSGIAAADVVERYMESGEGLPGRKNAGTLGDPMIGVLRSHQEDFIARRKVLEQKIPVAKERARSLILSFIDSGRYKVDRKVAEQRMELLEFLVVDNIIAVMNGYSGWYWPSAHTCEIPFDTLKYGRFKHVIAHEMLHAVSGRTEQGFFHSEFEEFDNFEATRSGLHFSQYDRLDMDYLQKRNIEMRRPILRWLNEAVTQSITLEITKGEDTGSYKNERQLLELLIKYGGISRDLVYNAYFENFDQSGDLKNPTPHLRELFTKLNKNCGDRFLVNLDTFIKSLSWRTVDDHRAVEETVKKWQEMGEAFIPYVHQMAVEARERTK